MTGFIHIHYISCKFSYRICVFHRSLRTKHLGIEFIEDSFFFVLFSVWSMQKRHELPEHLELEQAWYQEAHCSPERTRPVQDPLPSLALNSKWATEGLLSLEEVYRGQLAF